MLKLQSVIIDVYIYILYFCFIYKTPTHDLNE